MTDVVISQRFSCDMLGPVASPSGQLMTLLTPDGDAGLRPIVACGGTVTVGGAA